MKPNNKPGDRDRSSLDDMEDVDHVSGKNSIIKRNLKRSNDAPQPGNKRISNKNSVN